MMCGSSAANTTSTSTTTVTNTTSNNVVQTNTHGADAVALANALGAQLNHGLDANTHLAEQVIGGVTANLQSLVAGAVAVHNGSELETSAASSVTPGAQIGREVMIGLVVVGLGAWFFSGKGK